MITTVRINRRIDNALNRLAEETGTTLSDLFIEAVRMAAADQLDLGAALNARKGQEPSEAVRTGYYLAKKDADVPGLLDQVGGIYHLERADVARLILEAYIAHLSGIHPADRR